MKKQYVLIITIALLAIIIGLGVHYLLSLRKVSFVLDNSTEKITLYTSADKEVKEFSSTGSVLLKEGDYYIIPEGESIASDKINFSVGDKDTSIPVEPSYTPESLEAELEKEVSAIETAVISTYPSIVDGYSLEEGSLYKKGDWFGGLLIPETVSERDQKDYYRVILQKKDGTWKVVRRPEYTLSSSRYEEVPVDILRDINEKVW